MRILATGGTGFVGRRVCAMFAARAQHEVIAAVRSAAIVPGARMILQPAPWDLSDWRTTVRAVDVVVHLAARAHVMREANQDLLTVYRRANTATTLRLAEQSAEAGVKRFVFLSSIKVNGDETVPGRPFSAADEAQPRDAYAVSKWEAERGLREIAVRTKMEVVIIRPPLVYGPGVKANMASLMRWVRRGVPLPFGATNNLRSLVALDNLVDLIENCLRNPAAANQTLLVSDTNDVSTGELVRRLAQAMGRPARLFPVPVPLVKCAAAALGRPGLPQRLFGSLQVDAEPTCRLLDWRPPVSLDEGLRRMVNAPAEAYDIIE